MPYSIWHDAPHESTEDFLPKKHAVRRRDRNGDLAIAGAYGRTSTRLEVSPGICGGWRERVVGYDNETGKGDHKHFDKRELPYRFVDVETLVADFYADIRSYK